MKWRYPVAGALVASAAASIAFAQFDEPRARVNCCVASGRCHDADSFAACDAAIIEHSKTQPRSDPDAEGVARVFPNLLEPKHIEAAIDTVELQVLSCEDLSRDAAPIPEGAITLEVLRWSSCEVEFVDQCLDRSRARVAWPRYSDGHLGIFPVFRDAQVGRTFRVRLEQRDSWLRVRGAEEIPELTGAACTQ